MRNVRKLASLAVSITLVSSLAAGTYAANPAEGEGEALNSMAAVGSESGAAGPSSSASVGGGIVSSSSPETAEAGQLPAGNILSASGEGSAVKAEREAARLQPVYVSTAAGTAPELPSVVTAVYDGGSSESIPVSWEPVAPEQYAVPGASFTVQGSVYGTDSKASASVYVTSELKERLVTWYPLDSLDGTRVPEVSGRGSAAAAMNGASVIEVSSKKAVDLDHTKDQYIQLPTGVMSELDDFTLTTWVYLDSKTGDWARIFDFGTGVSAGKMFMTQNLYFDMTGRIADPSPNVPGFGEWTHVAITKSGNEFTIYKNGLKAATGTSSKKPSDYGATQYNYIGKSNWTADPYLDGKIRDFRLYDRGLTSAEVQSVLNESVSDEEVVAAAKAALELGDTSRVVADLELPVAGANGVAISWHSDRPEFLSDAGKVTRPSKEQPDAAVQLTATLSRNGHSESKTFPVTVLADSIVSIDEVQALTMINFPPKLPKQVSVRHYDGRTEMADVTWAAIPEEQLSQTGVVEARGTLRDTSIQAVAKVTVSELVSVDEVKVTTSAGEAPQLPSTVTAHYANGETAELPVTWGSLAKEAYSQAGTVEITGQAAAYQYENPLIEQRADPHIYKHTDGYYYFTASVPEYDRIILRRAKTIQGLAQAEEIVIWNKHASGEMSKHIWAPEIHFIDGKWYIYFAAGKEEDIWAIRPYVLECADANPLTGTWVEKGIMQKPESNKVSFTDFSLDATTFEHNGTRYLVWAQKLNGISNLYLAEMENAWTIKGDQVLLATPDYSWERIGFWVNEGASVLKRNGKIFISFSASATDSNYAMGLLTASDTSDLLDPKSWVKSPLPLMASDVEASQYGPGHNSFTVAEDGITDILVYHARSYKNIVGDPLYDPNRHTRVQRITWNKDGTPNFGRPEPNGLTAGPAVPVKAVITVLGDTKYAVETSFNLTELKANEKLEAKVGVTNRKGPEGPVTAVLALYDKSNTLVQLQSASKNAEQGAAIELDVAMQLPGDVEGYRAKVFVWEGSDVQSSALKPASKPFVLE
ncbi:family 43 glycosylhydrolase [Paenibacillus turpanensis]|uniref:family 43 glycosylhydrolase n=1 Tax=Paenibacillus turpanensis TaxID=2689078 RepID=UPI0014092D70